LIYLQLPYCAKNINELHCMTDNNLINFNLFYFEMNVFKVFSLLFSGM